MDVSIEAARTQAVQQQKVLFRATKMPHELLPGAITRVTLCYALMHVHALAYKFTKRWPHAYVSSKSAYIAASPQTGTLKNHPRLASVLSVYLK